MARQPAGSPWKQALADADLDALRAWLADGGDPNAPGVLGGTVLHRAVELGRVALVDALLAAGADPRRRDQRMRTPLVCAVQAATALPLPPVALVDRLIDAGADPSDPVHPPLVAAVEAASGAHVARLLARGADPRVGRGGTTALHEAFVRGRDALAGALIRAGADRSALDARELWLDEIYGPDGEDLRPLEVRWAGGPLTLTLRLAVTNPADLRVLRTGLSLDAWRRFGAAGLMGGATVSGEPLSLQGASAGFTTRTVTWGLGAASADFVRLLLASIRHEPAAADPDRGAPRPVRVVGLRAEGAEPGPTRVTADEVRAAADPSALFRRTTAPVPLSDDGGPPGVRLVAAGRADEVARRLDEGLRAVLDQAATWPWTGLGAFSTRAPKVGAGGAVEVRWDDLTGAKGAPSAWPWPREASLAAIEQVIAAIHADLPLVRASGSLP